MQIRRNSKDVNEELPHFDPLKSIQMEKIKNHNNTIETKYLDHELNKFKKEISMTRSRLLVVHDNLEYNALAYKPLDNSNLISSFSQGHNCVEDFYRESANATMKEKQIFENVTNPTDEVSMNTIDDDIECINNLSDADDMKKFDERYVHFGDLIEIINYNEVETTNSGKCSEDGQLGNLNYDIEIEQVLEVKLVPKEHSATQHTLELIGRPMQQSGDKITTTKQEEKETPKIHLMEGTTSVSGDIQLLDPNPFIITKLLDVTNYPKSTISEPNVDTDNQIQPEQNAIVSDLFTNNIHNDAMRQNTLQKFFLKWIHFTTIEKLSKENISCNQSRIQKIETFLNNVRLEKKKQIRNDVRIVEVKKKISEPENPVVLARKYHHK